MKNLTKLFLGVAAFVAFGNVAVAQYNITFETPATSAGKWTGTSAFDINSTVENTLKTGINASDSCHMLVIQPSAPAWAMGWAETSAFMPAGEQFIVTNLTSIVTMMVKSTVISKWAMKLEGENPDINGNSPGNMIIENIENTKVNEWEMLTFDFTDKLNGAHQPRIVIMPNVPHTTEQVVYWDDIIFGDGAVQSLSSASAAGISVSPNPTSGSLKITAGLELSQVSVSNILGQVVKTVSVSGLSSTVDVSELAAGTYVVSIQLANGTVATQKVVKQ